MLYGITLDSARDGIMVSYGPNVWKHIVHELELPSETFDLFTHYSDKILLNISECLVDILHEGTRDTYLKFLGQHFFRYLNDFGYNKLFRIAGKTLREFFFVIDQLHDSNRFTFPQMKNPTFHLTEENNTGATIEYKSVRHGFTHYAIGSLLGVAKTIFNENNIRIYVRSDLSTKEHTHVVLWIQFDNKSYQTQRLFNFPVLPDLTGRTFFKVFPFSILMDSTLHIRHMGTNIRKLFPWDIFLIGRSLNEVFRLIRPDIHVEWNKIFSYGQHIVFLMENRLPLNTGPFGRIRLKGQMKYIQNKNMLMFLCHPVLESADDIISAGLHLTDLNLFDNTGELLITSMRQTREMEDILEKEKICITQSQQIKNKLLQYRKRSQSLLYALLPKHIVSMIQSGIQSYRLCESFPLITIMFAYIINFKMSTTYLKPNQIIGLLNEAINIFDDITDKYDVFKIKTKMDATYMIVAGLHDRSNIIQDDMDSILSLTMPFNNDDDDNENEKNPYGLNPTEIIANLSFELLHASEHLINPITHKPFGIKIGFHTGRAIGGMVGDQKLQYCIFGDAVSTAKQIMVTGDINRIHISQTAYHHLVANNRFIIEYRGQTDINGKSTNATYWLTGINKKSSTTPINKNTQVMKCPFSGKFF